MASGCLPTIVGGRETGALLPCSGLASIDLSRAFGAHLRRTRESAKVSQEELAHRAGLSRNYVSLLERGLRNPTLNSMAMLARALGLSLVEFIRVLDRTSPQNR